MIILLIIFLTVSGMAHGIREVLQFHWHAFMSIWPDNNQQYWNIAMSWRNKYKEDDSGDLIPSTSSSWYYLKLYKPMYMEAFPYSSTLLVFLTDGYHMMNFLHYTLRLFSVALSMILAGGVVAALAFDDNNLAVRIMVKLLLLWIIIPKFGFHFTYSWIFKSN